MEIVGLKDWEVLKALDEGKELEYYDGVTGKWLPSHNIASSCYEHIHGSNRSYRIKQEKITLHPKIISALISVYDDLKLMDTTEEFATMNGKSCSEMLFQAFEYEGLDLRKLMVGYGYIKPVKFEDSLWTKECQHNVTWLRPLQEDGSRKRECAKCGKPVGEAK